MIPTIRENHALSLQQNSPNIFDAGGYYICFKRMFLSYYNALPNVFCIKNLDYIKAQEWIETKFAEEIVKKHFYLNYNGSETTGEYENVLYLFKDSFMVNIEDKLVSISFLTDSENRAIELKNELNQFEINEKLTTEINLIISGPRGLTLEKIDLKKPRINLNTHYNSDFKIIHQSIVQNLRKKQTKGLFLFHGAPGTGKSTYIRFLIHQQKKKVIFLSPNMAGHLDNFSFTELLLNNRNSVLVIEDAEELILSREDKSNSKLSFLLNLTDGLLADSLGIQIIATFNTDIVNIDSALLRKGRLTCIYEFKPLELGRTNTLLKKLGHNYEAQNPMSLSDIFNFEKNIEYRPKLKKVIGFGN